VHPILFKIPFTDFPVHTYGVLIVIGFMLAMFIAHREPVRHGFIEKGEEVLDFGFWALLGGLIGARVVFILVNIDDYLKDPLLVFNIFRGGLVFYGAFLGGFTAFVIFAKKRGYNLIDGLMLADYLAIGIPVAQAFGRFGCMAAGCCWGQPAFHLDEAGKVVQDIPFAAQFPAAHGEQPASLAYQSLVRNPPGGLPEGVDGAKFVELLQTAHETTPLFPSQLAEALGASIMFVILLFIRSRKWFHGQILLSYAAMYAAMRFTLEFFRGDAGRGVGVVSTSQGIAIGVVVLCVVAMFVLRNKGLTNTAKAS